jgi:hypothetical protein
MYINRALHESEKMHSNKVIIIISGIAMTKIMCVHEIG